MKLTSFPHKLKQGNICRVPIAFSPDEPMAAAGPNYAGAHHWFGGALESLGHFDEALAQSRLPAREFAKDATR